MALALAAAFPRACVEAITHGKSDAGPTSAAPAAPRGVGRSKPPTTTRSAPSMNWLGEYKWTAARSEPFTDDGEPRMGRGVVVAATLTVESTDGRTYRGRYERIGTWSPWVRLNVSGRASGDVLRMQGADATTGAKESIELRRARDGTISALDDEGRPTKVTKSR